jgi:hypothetical protein
MSSTPTSSSRDSYQMLRPSRSVSLCVGSREETSTPGIFSSSFTSTCQPTVGKTPITNASAERWFWLHPASASSGSSTQTSRMTMTIRIVALMYAVAFRSFWK